MVDEKTTLDSIEDVLEDIRQGRMVIVVDDEERENEGDLLMAAEKVTPEAVNFMVRYGRGLVCVPITQEKARQLNLQMMVTENSDLHGTAFTISIDARGVTTTGISAHDRAMTIVRMLDDSTKPDDFRRPGHIFPLVARNGGVLRRAGHTEASVDIARFAGFKPMGVICEIMNDDGTMARLPQLRIFAREHGLKIASIAQLIKYRNRLETLVELVAEVNLPTQWGDFTAKAFRFILDSDPDRVHFAIIKGDISGDDPVLVRVHSECLTGDVFGSMRCDCGPQLHQAMEMLNKEGRGVLLYLRQEGRGIGLLNKLKAYELQEKGQDTVEANISLGFPPDLRDYGLGAQIMTSLGLKKIKLVTNNPRKIIGLSGYGLEVAGRVPLVIEPNIHNEHYLNTKSSKLGHYLPFGGEVK